MLTRVVRLGALGLGLAVHLGCSNQSEEVIEFSQGLTDLLAGAPVVAGMDTTHLDGELGTILHARLLGRGAGVVVSDFAPPFLRVFDQDGRLIASALQRGGGPQEARSVHAVAVSGADRILVLTSTGLREFSFEDGSLRFVAAHPRPHEMSMFALASFCDDGWAAYIPPATTSLAVAPIVASSARDDSGRLAWTERLRWPTLARSRAWGKLYQMTSDHERVYIRHDYHPQAPIIAMPCDAVADSVEVLRYTQTTPENSELVPVSDVAAVAVITYPWTVYTGFAVWRGMLLESEATTDRARGGSTSTTTFSLADERGRRSVVVAGKWYVRDARDSNVLISTVDPVPRVILLPMSDIDKVIR